MSDEQLVLILAKDIKPGDLVQPTPLAIDNEQRPHRIDIACFYGLDFYITSRGQGATLYVRFKDTTEKVPFDLTLVKDLADWFLAGWRAKKAT